MTRLPRLAGLAAAAALSIVLLSGCSGGGAPTPTVTVTVTPTSSPTTPATPATSSASPEPTSTKTVTLNADGIAVTAPEGTILAGYYGGVIPAVNALSVVFGTVQPAVVPAGKCSVDQTTYDWGALKLTYLGTDAASATAFTLHATVAPTTVQVTTALGAHVGGDWKSYFAGVPSSQPSRPGVGSPSYDEVLESSTPGADSSTSGTVVTATDGVISSIAVPQNFNGDC